MTRSLAPQEISRNLHIISELYLKGRKQYEMPAIMAKMNIHISESSVRRAISLLQEEWRRERIHNINALKQIQLEKIDLLEREYYAAWMRSQRMAVKRVSRSGTVGPNSVSEDTETKEKQVGDPRFLQGIQWCVDKRCEILGINNATRQEAMGITVKSIVIQLPPGAQAVLGNIPQALPLAHDEESESDVGNTIDGEVSEVESNEDVSRSVDGKTETV